MLSACVCVVFCLFYLGEWEILTGGLAPPAALSSDSVAFANQDAAAFALRSRNRTENRLPERKCSKHTIGNEPERCLPKNSESCQARFVAVRDGGTHQRPAICGASTLRPVKPKFSCAR